MIRDNRLLPRDWKQLLEAPYLIYLALVEGDDKSNFVTRRQEAKALIEFFEDYEPATPLVAELIKRQVEVGDMHGTYDEAMAQLEQVGKLIDRKVSEKEEAAIRGFLIDVAEEIAEASVEERKLIGRTKATNRDEKRTIRKIKKALNPRNIILLPGRRKRRRKAKVVKKVGGKIADRRRD